MCNYALRESSKTRESVAATLSRVACRCVRSSLNRYDFPFLQEFSVRHLSLVISFPAEAPLPDPTPTPPNTPKRTRNRPETAKSSSLGCDGRGVCRNGGARGMGAVREKKEHHYLSQDTHATPAKICGNHRHFQTPPFSTARLQKGK